MSTINVFLIDAQASSRKGLAAALREDASIWVTGEAADAHSAALALRESRPDVVILGLDTPDSLLLVAEVRILHPDACILALAAPEDSEGIARALQAGANGIVAKTAPGEDIVAAVHRLQRGGAVLSAASSAALIDDYLLLRNREAISPIKRLSRRERQVLEMVVTGKTSHEIADQLAISPKSVGTYRSRIMAKLGVRNAPGLVKVAIARGLVEMGGK